MRRFLDWANRGSGEPPLVKAGLARADGSPQRFDSLAAQIQRERSACYSLLELSQKATMDVTGRLTSSQWAAIAKCSPDTALRDIGALLDCGVLRKAPGGGRSTAYELAGGLSGGPESAPQHTPHSP